MVVGQEDPCPISFRHFEVYLLGDTNFCFWHKWSLNRGNTVFRFCPNIELSPKSYRPSKMILAEYVVDGCRDERPCVPVE